MSKTNFTIDGRPVRDAKRDLTLEILVRDITGAKPKDVTACAAARAAKRICHALEVRVYMSVTYILQQNKVWERFMTPPSLAREIVVIDRSGGHFSPGEYLMKAPYPTRQLGRHKPTGPKATQGKKHRFRHMTENVRQSAGRHQ